MPLVLSAQKFCDDSYEIMKAYSESLSSPPNLHVYVMGSNSPSWIYIRHKQKIAERLGIDIKIISLDEHLSTQEVIQVAKNANLDDSCDAILFQLPLSPQVNAEAVLNLIDPEKDVDGLSVYNQGLLAKGNLEQAIIPCTPLGIIRLLKYYGVSLQAKRMLIIGRSTLVGRPLGLYALSENATVTIAHSQTPDLRACVAEADIIVCATGRHPLLEWNMLNEHQILIDVGIHRTAQGKIHGDMPLIGSDEPSVAAYTPVPGSIGPMTINSLMYNIFKVHALKHKTFSQWQLSANRIEHLTHIH